MVWLEVEKGWIIHAVSDDHHPSTSLSPFA